MKKYVLIISLLCALTITAQSKLDGNYSSSPYEMMIQGNHLVIRSLKMLGLPSYILADCWIKNIKKYVIEVSSKEYPAALLFKDIKISYSRNERLNNKIQIKFILPHFEKEIKITVSTNFKDYSLNYSLFENTLEIPNNGIEDIEIFIDNPLLDFSLNADNTFYGVLFFKYPYKINIKKDMNVINVCIPGLNEEILHSYYIKDDYMLVSNKNIYWRGRRFEKSNKKKE